ncbi:hypothetical protein CVCC1112_2870 [Paenarthrobacter nicotinovorans]|nr:hypothetical protein CVCC1112_2870 [Paenarthrobacter nicotinovorans]
MWATLIVPIFAALASTAVAIVSATIAKKARDIAETSENSRSDAEIDRINREYKSRMHEAFIELFEDVARLAEALQEHDSFVERVTSGSYNVPLTGGPRDPSDMQVLAKIAAARLLAKNADEIDLLDQIRALTLQSRTKGGLVRAAILAEVWPIVILWQNAGSNEKQALLARFDELRAIESVAQPPSWVADASRF